MHVWACDVLLPVYPQEQEIRRLCIQQHGLLQLRTPGLVAHRNFLGFIGVYLLDYYILEVVHSFRPLDHENV